MLQLCDLALGLVGGMRVDAAEFVPFAAASNDDAWTGSSHPSMPGSRTMKPKLLLASLQSTSSLLPRNRYVGPRYGGGVGAASGLSADSPAFVPGAQDMFSSCVEGPAQI